MPDNCPPPPLYETLLVSTRGWGQLSGYAKNTFLGQKFQNNCFFKLFPEIFFFVFFHLFFFTAEVSHFLGQKIQKHFFFSKKIFSKIVFAKIFFSIFLFLLRNLVTFWGNKFKKIFLCKKKFWKKCF